MASSTSYEDDFGINNIPFGVASSVSHNLARQCVSRIGNRVILLVLLAKEGLFLETGQPLEEIFAEPTLNRYAALPKGVHQRVRSVIQSVISSDLDLPTVDITEVQMHLPVAVGDFTDFSASREHVLNAGEVITGKRGLPPAFLSFPVGYAGRSSSIVVSGTPIERPVGQFIDRKAPDAGVICRPSRQIDFELEVGAIVGRPVARGQRVMVEDANEHVFGFVLLNDWSARDIQGYEMIPLGPFNGKNFGTTISHWVITLDALEPYKAVAPPHEAPVANYLHDPLNETYSISLNVDVRVKGSEPYTRVCESKMETMYWSFWQMLAHHTIGGCSLRTGDIIASGTVSGVGQGERGCLLESTWGGQKPISLLDGSKRGFLEDGDEVRFTGRAGPNGTSDVGFGECVGQLLPARPLS